MDDVQEVHERIVLLEHRRQELYRDRMRTIHERSLRNPTSFVVEGGEEFVAQTKKIEEELRKLWAEKRLLLTGSSDGCNA